MIKVDSKDEVFDFIRKWKPLETEYKKQTIKARGDKPPEQRKSNGKIYGMAQHLRETLVDKEKEIDADFKNSSVWIGDFEIVKWDMQSESFQWFDDALNSAGVVVDRVAAEKKTDRP